MNTNRAMMRVRLADLSEEQTIYRNKSAAAIEAIQLLVNPVLMEVEKMDITMAATHMDTLVVCQAELLVVRDKIAALNQALYS